MIPDEESKLQRAKLLISANRYPAAEKELHLLLAQFPESPEGHAWLGYCKVLCNKIDEGIKLITHAIALRPDNAFFHYLLSESYWKADDLLQSEKCIKEALRLRPDNASLVAMQAKIFCAKGEWVNAIRESNRALSLNAEHHDAHKWLAYAQFKLDLVKESEETVRSALRLDPTDDFLHSLLASTQLKDGDARVAFDAFRESVRLNPTEDRTKAGLVKAMKNRYWAYNVYLRYIDWRRQYTWTTFSALIIFLVIIAIAIFDRPQPWILNALALFGFLFIGMLYLAEPIASLIVNFNNYWRNATEKDRRWLVWPTMTGLVITVVGTVLLFFQPETAGISLTIFGVAIIILFGGLYHRRDQEGTVAATVWVVFVLLLGLLCIPFSSYEHPTMPGFGFFVVLMRWRLDG